MLIPSETVCNATSVTFCLNWPRDNCPSFSNFLKSNTFPTLFTMLLLDFKKILAVESPNSFIWSMACAIRSAVNSLASSTYIFSRSHNSSILVPWASTICVMEDRASRSFRICSANLAFCAMFSSLLYCTVNSYNFCLDAT